MSKASQNDKSPRKAPKVSYFLRYARKGEPVFQDIHLPDGTIIRRVDRAVHEKGLVNASKQYLEKYGR